MPRRDGSGPARGGGGRMGGPAAGGPGGRCVCPSCGYEVDHARGVPCNTRKCPQCGTMMTRD